MTTNAINCEVFNDRLMAYLEHELDDAAHASIERHAIGCDDCGALLADLRKLRVDAANLPQLTPSRDLWTGIAARIETPVVSIDRTSTRAIPTRTVKRWMSSAAVAAGLLAAAGIGYFVASNGQTRESAVFTEQVDSASPRGPQTPSVALVPDSSRTGTTSPDASRGATPAPSAQPAVVAPRPDNQAVSAQLAVATLMADYDREVVKLRQLIEQRRNQLDPVTVAIIEKNLQVIDTAIGDSQRAIQRDPSSRFLIESLNQSLQTKVELMRTAALLPSRT